MNYSPLPNPRLPHGCAGHLQNAGGVLERPRLAGGQASPTADTPRASYAASRTSSSFEDSVATAALEAAGIGAGFITTAADFDWNSIDG